MGKASKLFLSGLCQGTGWQTVGADLRCVRRADPGGGEESCGAYRPAVRPRRSGIDHQALGEQQQREPKRHLDGLLVLGMSLLF